MSLMGLLALAAIPAIPKTDPNNWLAETDYPKSLIASEKEGPVVVQLDVDERGKPVACRVTTSSTIPELDHLTCKLLVERAQFTPPNGQDGKPVKSTYVQTVRWKIPREQLVTQGFKMVAAVDPDGVLSDCRLVKYGSGKDVPPDCDLRMLEAFAAELPEPLASYSEVGAMLAMEVEGEGITVPQTTTDDRVVMAQALVDVSAAGAFTGCQTEVVAAMNGRSLDICADLVTIGEKEFDEDPQGRVRRFSVGFEASGTRR